ncbi:uncharacterized protein LOC108628709 [Ceratina calcarata]|uniref:Uncharacterized protein LOC108628709 n=1 Tax=Ceratina calcarata TaxID=156304 RepID=A0AAJ7J828_9HYME|nr:uncharacterized protein LOC108628709 [Ceratina calcarata]
MDNQRDKVQDDDEDPLLDLHREYLDAESSDEEEAKKQRKEVDEIEEELGPTYDEQELSDLVNCVKDMTTLGGLSEDDWSYYVKMTIREFITSPNTITTLTLYWLHDRLTASLSFPLIPVYELCYFVREPREILRMETFRDHILFGTINDKVEYHLLSTMRNVLAPVFLKIDTWPDSILPFSCGHCDPPSTKCLRSCVTQTRGVS